MSIYPNIVDNYHSGGIGGVYIPATAPLPHSSYYNVMTTEFENGVEQRRLLHENPKRNVKVNYTPITFTDSIILKQFYQDMRGSFSPFVFYFPQYETQVKEFCGVADSGDNRIKLPSYDAASYTLYRNNVGLTYTIEYTVQLRSGPDLEDIASLNFSSNDGDVYHWSFTGYLKMGARFANSPFQVTETQRLLTSLSVELESLEANGCYTV